MTPFEKEIISASRQFAQDNNIPFDGSSENMILNAIREYDKRSKMEESLITHYEDYIKLLGEEISELCAVARADGWQSSRVQAGETLREKIAAIRDNVTTKYIKHVTK